MSRFTYLFKRVALSIPVIIFGTTVTFAIIRLGPLSPAAAILGPQGDARAIRQIEQRLGLNEPLWEQYFDFMGNLFLFDLANRGSSTPERRPSTSSSAMPHGRSGSGSGRS